MSLLVVCLPPMQDLGPRGHVSPFSTSVTPLIHPSSSTRLPQVIGILVPETQQHILRSMSSCLILGGEQGGIPMPNKLRTDKVPASAFQSARGHLHTIAAV